MPRDFSQIRVFPAFILTPVSHHTTLYYLSHPLFLLILLLPLTKSKNTDHTLKASQSQSSIPHSHRIHHVSTIQTLETKTRQAKSHERKTKEKHDFFFNIRALCWSDDVPPSWRTNPKETNRLPETLRWLLIIFCYRDDLSTNSGRFCNRSFCSFSFYTKISRRSFENEICRNFFFFRCAGIYTVERCSWVLSGSDTTVELLLLPPLVIQRKVWSRRLIVSSSSSW